MKIHKTALPLPILAVSALIFFNTVLHTTIDLQPLHVHGRLSAPAQDIFALLGHPEITTLAEANAYAQTYLIRRGERWDMQEPTAERRLIHDKRTAIVHNLRQLGMINEINPPRKQYTYIGLMGALRERIELRLAYLQALVNDGFSFDYLVLLGGMRELQDAERAGLPADITQELTLMRYLVANSALKECTIIEVNAPMVQKADGSFARPTTDDTIRYFAEIAPVAGSFLVISNNPYIQRQTKVTKRLLDQTAYTIDGAGSALDAEKADIAITMDEFARTLYEDFQQFQSLQ